MIDGPEKVSGRAKYTADILAPGHARRPHLSQPLFARRDRRGRRVGSAQSSRRARHRHRRRLRQAVRRAADRAQRIPAGARQGALSRRAGGRGCRRSTMSPRARRCAASSSPCANCRPITRRRTRWRRAPCNCTRRSPAMSSATCCSSWARPSKALPRPTWCARAPTTAPKSARIRWRCTRPSPNTTRCATA